MAGGQGRGLHQLIAGALQAIDAITIDIVFNEPNRCILICGESVRVLLTAFIRSRGGAVQDVQELAALQTLAIAAGLDDFQVLGQQLLVVAYAEEDLQSGDENVLVPAAIQALIASMQIANILADAELMERRNFINRNNLENKLRSLNGE